MDQGPEMVSKVILVIKELDGVASARLDHALCLVASSFINLSENRRKEAVNRSTNKLAGMLNKDYSPCLGSLFKVDVESTVSTFFDC